MIMKIDLLDALSMWADCRYLSDLKYLDEWRRARLARALEKLPADAADLKEWNDALQYLSRDAPQETAEAARERLIQSLSRPRQTGPDRPQGENPMAEIYKNRMGGTRT